MTDWRPSASLEILRKRAAMLAQIRAFFQTRGVLEVETPLMAVHSVTEPHIDSFALAYQQQMWHLQTSPEYAMKRLLAAGSGPIFQICKAFRNEEAGQFHNPEFTMLEWYQPGYTDVALITEVCELLQSLLPDAACQVMTYQHVFQRYLDIDPLAVDLTTLHTCITQHIDINLDAITDVDTALQLLLTHCIEPKLPKQTLFVLKDYPASQAALAELSDTTPQVAKRFEVYFNGQELANGFQELTNADVQRQRFESDNQKRRSMNKPEMSLDEPLLAALEQGLPKCAGVAIGLDRVLMCQQGLDTIASALAFPVKTG